jgi:hypothetical protein
VSASFTRQSQYHLHCEHPIQSAKCCNLIGQISRTELDYDYYCKMPHSVTGGKPRQYRQSPLCGDRRLIVRASEQGMASFEEIGGKPTPPPTVVRSLDATWQRSGANVPYSGSPRTRALAQHAHVDKTPQTLGESTKLSSPSTVCAFILYPYVQLSSPPRQGKWRPRRGGGGARLSSCL